ncbi:MAG: hypothetical protein HFJ64_00495 [Eggerthellaceae bacterium]|nr:hypothetical protein [Eggerthellaceae bacterium]
MRCPTCGALSFYDRSDMLTDEPVTCRKCGFEVTSLIHVNPAYCDKMGDWCGFPCERSADSFLEGFECPYITPIEGAYQETRS